MPTALPYESASVMLAPRELYSIADASSVRVACREGTLWITLDNDARDWVLEAGECFEAPRHARALLYAIGAVRIDLVALQSEDEASGFLRRFHSAALSAAAR